MLRSISSVLFTIAVFSAPLAFGALTDAQRNYFERNVRPLLANNCYQCHSAKEGKFKGGLSLDTKAGLLKGGDSGKVIAGKNPKSSLLWQAVRQTGELKMPPKKKLNSREIAVLTKWIKMGAPDPREAVLKEVVVESTIDVEKGREFWAFQLPAKGGLPTPTRAGWAKTDIDRFVLAKLEEKGLVPNAATEKRVLLRRLYFDLIGLPPSAEAVETFVRDDSRSAMERVVDELLASPRFGERWGRHWLDVARYAESNGMERNQLYPHAWRYRDYVLASFNADKPFDQFIREQIAGDLLAQDEPDRRDELIIATGFLAMGPKSLNERDRRQFQMDVVDEQIDIATRATMAITVSCARCHDHKFDPVSMVDYYALAGIFKSSKTQFNQGATQGVRQRSGLIELSKEANEADGVTYAPKTSSKSKKKKKNSRNKKTAKPSGPVAMGVVDGNVEDCAVHIRGDVANLGQRVARGIPAVMRIGDGPAFAGDASGRRELAGWLVAKENPLTARVFVNRVWHHLFGRGIVRTVDNFGETGARPSNQALLDHLAMGFMADGWSVKRLVKRMVLTRTYQLSSAPNPANSEIDAENEFFWKANHRRLDAESIRDAILSISGGLNFDPPTGSVVATMGETQIDRNLKQLAMVQAERPYRSVYLPVVRNNVSGMMTTFDFAEPSMIVGQRSITTVPSQALFLMNSRFMLKHSLAVAERILGDSSLTARERVGRVYRQVLNRKPNALERERALAFVESCLAKEPDEANAWAGLVQAVFGSAEFRYLD